MSTPCACDRDYDSDTGAMNDYVCDWCCDGKTDCQKHAAELRRIKQLYYKMHAVGGHLLTGTETLGSHLHLQYDVLRQICAFVQESPDFIQSHDAVRIAIVDLLNELLQETMAVGLYDLFHETLAFADSVKS